MRKKVDLKRSEIGQRQVFAITAPDALNVKLVGNFTHWMERPIRLRRTKHGVWQTTVTLPRGSHHYHFLVDGECRGDPKCLLRESNPYGGLDDVRYVP